MMAANSSMLCATPTMDATAKRNGIRPSLRIVGRLGLRRCRPALDLAPTGTAADRLDLAAGEHAVAQLVEQLLATAERRHHVHQPDAVAGAPFRWRQPWLAGHQ